MSAEPPSAPEPRLSARDGSDLEPARNHSAMKRMGIWTRRTLTMGEIELAAGVFAAEIAYPKVRIVQAPKAGFMAMAPLRHTVIYSGWRAPHDVTEANIDEQGWFIHELAHVWQAARGVILPAAKLAALGRRAYAYRLMPGARFEAFNIEQQAEIARHLFLARRGYRAAGQPDRDLLEAVWPVRS